MIGSDSNPTVCGGRVPALEGDLDDESLPIMKSAYSLIYRITLEENRQIFHPRGKSKFISQLRS